MATIRDTGRSWFPSTESPAFVGGRGGGSWPEALEVYFGRWKGFAELWSKHRAQDLHSTIELALRPLASLDPKELADMQQKWMAGIVDRYMLDTVALAKNSVSLPFGAVLPGIVRASVGKSATDGAVSARHRAKRG